MAIGHLYIEAVYMNNQVSFWFWRQLRAILFSQKLCFLICRKYRKFEEQLECPFMDTRKKRE